MIKSEAKVGNIVATIESHRKELHKVVNVGKIVRVNIPGISKEIVYVRGLVVDACCEARHQIGEIRDVNYGVQHLRFATTGEIRQYKIDCEENGDENSEERDIKTGTIEALGDIVNANRIAAEHIHNYKHGGSYYVYGNHEERLKQGTKWLDAGHYLHNQMLSELYTKNLIPLEEAQDLYENFPFKPIGSDKMSEYATYFTVNIFTLRKVDKAGKVTPAKRVCPTIEYFVDTQTQALMEVGAFLAEKHPKLDATELIIQVEKITAYGA